MGRPVLKLKKYPNRRRPVQVKRNERKKIQILLAKGEKPEVIAFMLNRAPSTIYSIRNKYFLVKTVLEFKPEYRHLNKLLE